MGVSREMRYDDAFTICLVEAHDVANFRMFAGMVPFLQKLISDVGILLILHLCRIMVLILLYFLVVIDIVLVYQMLGYMLLCTAYCTQVKTNPLLTPKQTINFVQVHFLLTLPRLL